MAGAVWGVEAVKEDSGTTTTATSGERATGDQRAEIAEPTPGPWQWEIHDHSMASLQGPRGEWQHVLSVSPCDACQKRAHPQDWKWGRCTTPTEANARVLAASWELLDTLNHAEAVMSIVEPRSEKAQYLHCLNRIRSVIAKATGPLPDRSDVTQSQEAR